MCKTMDCSCAINGVDENMQCEMKKDEGTDLFYNFDPGSNSYYYVNDDANIILGRNESLNNYHERIDHDDNDCNVGEPLSIQRLVTIPNSVTSSPGVNVPCITDENLSIPQNCCAINEQSNASFGCSEVFLTVLEEKSKTNPLILENSEYKQLLPQPYTNSFSSYAEINTTAKIDNLIENNTSSDTETKSKNKFRIKWSQEVRKAKDPNRVTGINTLHDDCSSTEAVKASSNQLASTFLMNMMYEKKVQKANPIGASTIEDLSTWKSICSNKFNLPPTLNSKNNQRQKRYNAASEFSEAFKISNNSVTSSTIESTQAEYDALLKSIETSSMAEQIENFNCQDDNLLNSYEQEFHNSQIQIEECRCCFGEAEEEQNSLYKGFVKLALLQARWMTIRNYELEEKAKSVLQKYEEKIKYTPKYTNSETVIH